MPHPRTVDAIEGTTRTREQRNKTRAIISTPVRVRGLGPTHRHFDETTTTVNLSSAGILIETANSACYRNMKVSVTVPYDKSAGAMQIEQEGCVVRIGEWRGGRRSVAISLDSAARALAPGRAHKRGRCAE